MAAPTLAPAATGPTPVTDWNPAMGHVEGAGYEWTYAAQQPPAARPAWQDKPLVPVPQLAGTTTATTARNDPSPGATLPEIGNALLIVVLAGAIILFVVGRYRRRPQD